MVICPPAIIHELIRKSPDALALLLEARALHWEKERFYLANAMAKAMGWDLDRFRRARRLLVECGYLWVLHKGGRGRGDPAEYGWPKVKGPNTTKPRPDDI
jgi:hypothetical protein